jgi:hypothetical protein
LFLTKKVPEKEPFHAESSMKDETTNINLHIRAKHTKQEILQNLPFTSLVSVLFSLALPLHVSLKKSPAT